MPHNATRRSARLPGPHRHSGASALNSFFNGDSRWHDLTNSPFSSLSASHVCTFPIMLVRLALFDTGVFNCRLNSSNRIRRSRSRPPSLGGGHNMRASGRRVSSSFSWLMCCACCFSLRLSTIVSHRARMALISGSLRPVQTRRGLQAAQAPRHAVVHLESP